MKTHRWLKDRTRTSHRVGEESGRRKTENTIKKVCKRLTMGVAEGREREGRGYISPDS